MNFMITENAYMKQDRLKIKNRGIEQDFMICFFLEIKF